MNQDNEALYFDSANSDANKLNIENNLELEKEENYKERHKDDLGQMSPIRRLIDTFGPAFIVSILVYILFQFILLNGTVPSGSMENTIMTGNLILSNRLAYIDEEPQRGDVVVFWSDEYGQLLVKRVIGVAGDVIDLKDGDVYINKTKVFENYIQGKTWSSSSKDERFVVPEGELFLMGDNRENSGDSRIFKDTFIEVDDIEGKVFLHYSVGGDDGVYMEKIESEAPIFLED